MVKAAARWAKKQIERATIAGPEYEEGIKAPERNPIEAALAANDKRIANLKQSIEEKTWEKVMRTITIEDWRRGALEKGVPRFPDGIEKAKPKIEAFVSKWQPILAGIQESIRAMPEATDAQREARLLANLRALKKAKGTWR